MSQLNPMAPQPSAVCSVSDIGVYEEFAEAVYSSVVC